MPLSVELWRIDDWDVRMNVKEKVLKVLHSLLLGGHHVVRDLGNSNLGRKDDLNFLDRKSNIQVPMIHHIWSYIGSVSPAKTDSVPSEFLPTATWEILSSPRALLISASVLLSEFRDPSSSVGMTGNTAEYCCVLWA